MERIEPIYGMCNCTDRVTKSMLTRRISLYAMLGGGSQRRGKKKSREQRLADKLQRKENEVFQRKLEALAQPGDEWWAWMDGADEPEGMQLGGLALVRGGKIVWAEQIWMN